MRTPLDYSRAEHRIVCHFEGLIDDAESEEEADELRQQMKQELHDLPDYFHD
jgi:hypothetical protein